MQRQKTLSSQFGLTSGIRQAQSDFIMLPQQERAGRAYKRRGRLWILTEPATPTGGAGAAAKMVMETIEDEYYHSPAPTIATALEEAVSAANRLLCDYNAGAPGHKQAYLGVTCVVTHGKEAHFAQVEPARALIVHQGAPRTFPDRPPKAEEDLTPLGLNPEIAVDFSRSALASGDTISVLSSGLARSLSLTEDEYSLSYQDHAGAIEELCHLAARNNLLDEHAFVIEEPANKAKGAVNNSFGAIGREWFGKVGERAATPMKGARDRFLKTAQGASKDTGAEGWAPAWVKNRASRLGSFIVQRKAGDNGTKGSRFRMASTLLGVALLVLLALGLGYRGYSGYHKMAKFESLIAAAEKQRQHARGKPTETALTHLKAARDYLQDAKEIDPTHAKLRAEMKLINADWDVVNKVRRFSTLTDVSKLDGYADGSAARLVIEGNQALLLSRPAGVVTMYDLKSGRSDTLSPKKSVRFVGLAARRGSVFMLEEKGRVYTYDLSSRVWTSTKLGGKVNWKDAVAFESDGSSAFIGVKGAPGMLIYNLEAPRKPRVVESTVKGQEMSPSSLSSGSNVWLTNGNDDSLWKVVKGKVAKRLLVDAQPPVDGAFGLLAARRNKHLYMLDGQRNRILQVTRSGKMRSQLQLPVTFDGNGRIDAMYVDERAQRAYIVIGQTLYSATLPRSSAEE